MLAACELSPPDDTSAPQPKAAPQPAAFVPSAPSRRSTEIKTYYSSLQADLLSQGLMRSDAGGNDTPFTSDMLARNFEQIAFYDEHRIGLRLEKSDGQARLLARWKDPVRIKVEFGPSVLQEQRSKDTQTVNSFAARLAKITNHSVSGTANNANFHVLVRGEDDRSAMADRLAQLLPNLSTFNRSLLQNLTRDMHCLVVVSHSDGPKPTIMSALAIVRAEHPDLLREACFHEEIAQGMGLVNDSPAARPSIFNDDDEFALLTDHDEMLLRILYSTELNIGMSLETARPIVKRLAQAEMGESL